MAISHSRAYTARGSQRSLTYSGKELAKTVIMKIEDALAMAVLPPLTNVDPSLLKAAAGANTVVLAGKQNSKSVPRP